MAQNLLNQYLLSRKDVLLGEFVQKEDKIYVRYNFNDQIFNLDLTITSSVYGKNDNLKINSHSMKFISQQYVQQLYQANEDSAKYFQYMYIKEFKFDLGNNLISRMSC